MKQVGETEPHFWNQIFKRLAHDMPRQLLPLIKLAFGKECPKDTPIKPLAYSVPMVKVQSLLMMLRNEREAGNLSQDEHSVLVELLNKSMLRVFGKDTKLKGREAEGLRHCYALVTIHGRFKN